jgi:hypothetical protein
VLTEVHDVVAADGAVVDHDVCAHRTGENEIRTASGQEKSRERKRASERRESMRQLAAALTPGPERDGVPLLDLEALALLAVGAGAGGRGGGGGHGHGDVSLVHRERNLREKEP